MFLARHADRFGEEGWLSMTEMLKGRSTMPKEARKVAKHDEAERAADGYLICRACLSSGGVRHPSP
ncbi:hypothetical protein ASG96_22395 [Terrabacter sp. Soil810]|nr:hypothetical protein ASG96_22395 [Terrabacter sp. Soil810]